MRAKDALGAARQYTGDAFEKNLRALTEMASEHSHQSLSEIAAGEVIDTAVTFGLTDDRYYPISSERTLDHKRLQGRHSASFSSRSGR
jgi:hypothetical protein